MFHVLQKAAELFSAAYQCKDADRWAVYVDAIADLTAPLSGDEWSTLVAEARTIRMSKEDTPKLAYLWIFSHATPAIFQGFINNAHLRRGFGQLLSLKVSQQGRTRRGRGRRNGRPAAQSKEETARRAEVAEFLDDYEWLLVEHNVFFFTLRTLRGRHDGKLLTLFPFPALSDRSKETLLHEARTRFFREHWGSFGHRIALARQLGYVQKDVEERVTAKLLELIPTEIDEVVWEIPMGWRSIGALTTYLERLPYRRAWPVFAMAPQPTLNSSRATFIYPAIDRLVYDAFDRELGGYFERATALRKVRHGRSPVGLKFHFLSGAPSSGFDVSVFKIEQSDGCVVLPPVGSIGAVEELVEVIERRHGITIFGRPDVQVQVCSPGQLLPRHAALLGIVSYLGSSELCEYALENFTTTHPTGNRLVIYGAGVVDRSFEWWGKDTDGKLRVSGFPDGLRNRTDVLACRTLHDVEVVNLAATLLLHAEFEGYWADLGLAFAAAIEGLLARHQLSGLLDAGWVHEKKGADPDGAKFFLMFSELMAYAFAEYDRIEAAKARGDTEAARQGILAETRAILDHYRSEIIRRSPEEMSS